MLSSTPTAHEHTLYTVLLGTAFKEARVNAVSPGYVATNINNYAEGGITTQESAEGVIKYTINIDQNGPSSKFLDYTDKTWAW